MIDTLCGAMYISNHSGQVLFKRKPLVVGWAGDYLQSISSQTRRADLRVHWTWWTSTPTGALCSGTNPRMMGDPRSHTTSWRRWTKTKEIGRRYLTMAGGHIKMFITMFNGCEKLEELISSYQTGWNTCVSSIR